MKLKEENKSDQDDGVEYDRSTDNDYFDDIARSSFIEFAQNR